MKNKGFTLVEMLIVIAIFGLIAVMVATISPAIAQRSRMNRATNELVSDLNMAKQLASTENRFVAVDFSTDGRSYTIRKLKEFLFNPDPMKLTDDDIWVHVKTAKPLDGDQFFNAAAMTDFAFNSTGETRLFDADNPDPTLITLSIFIKKRRSNDLEHTKQIKVYPYGGIRVEQ